MLSPKKMIPSMAVAAIPLAGTACGDSALDKAVSAGQNFCATAAQCYADYDLDECVELIREYAQAYAQNYDDACLNAVASYFNCLANLSCADLMDPESAAAQVCTTFFDENVDPLCESED